MSRGAPDSIADALLREILVEVKGIRADLAAQHRPASSLSRADRLMLERLFQALVNLYPNGEVFTSRDIVAHPAPGLRLLRAGLSTKSLGRLFTRAAGAVIGGYRIERIGSELRVALWRVMPG